MIKKISIVIPVHNRKKVTIDCLKNLNSILKRGFETEVIVIDDGSTDNTADEIRQYYPDTVILNGDGNLWWSGAVNVGIEKALMQGSDYILTLNDDTEFCSNFVEELFVAAESNPDTIVGSLVVYRDKLNDRGFKHAGVNYSGYLRSIVAVLLSETDIEKHAILFVDALPGRSLLIPSYVLKNIGLFDRKRFPHGHADHEFTLRAKRRGYRVAVCTRSVVFTELNSNNLHVFLVHSGRLNVLKSFFGIKYGHNLKNLFYTSFVHKPVHVGILSFIVSMCRIAKWISLKMILPRQYLEDLLVKKNQDNVFASELKAKRTHNKY